MRVGIRARLLGGFGVVLALMALIAAVGYRNTSRFAAEFQTMYGDRLVPLVELNKASTSLDRLQFNAQVYQLASRDRQAKLREEDATLQQTIEESMAAYAAAGHVAEERDALSAWQQAYPAYVEKRQQSLALFDRGKTSDAEAARGEADQFYAQLNDAVAALVAAQERAGSEVNRRVSADAARSKLLLGGVALAAVAIGLAVALTLSRSIGRRVRQMAEAIGRLADRDFAALSAGMAALASGDLTQSLALQAEPLPARSSDEIGDLGRAINRMIDAFGQVGDAFNQTVAGLGGIVGEVRGAASRIGVAGEQARLMTGQISAATQE
ncbi:MAG: MCP four helix bundle domain-containing protein, partial [Thermomicrobiaceae bacterium]|nr:MCP four helix bundle domain-containing protein [Thermomicrobiaceae bacterium]